MPHDAQTAPISVGNWSDVNAKARRYKVGFEALEGTNVGKKQIASGHLLPPETRTSYSFHPYMSLRQYHPSIKTKEREIFPCMGMWGGSSTFMHFGFSESGWCQ